MSFISCKHNTQRLNFFPEPPLEWSIQLIIYDMDYRAGCFHCVPTTSSSPVLRWWHAVARLPTELTIISLTGWPVRFVVGFLCSPSTGYRSNIRPTIIVIETCIDWPSTAGVPTPPWRTVWSEGSPLWWVVWIVVVGLRIEWLPSGSVGWSSFASENWHTCVFIWKLLKLVGLIRNMLRTAM